MTKQLEKQVEAKKEQTPPTIALIRKEFDLPSNVSFLC